MASHAQDSLTAQFDALHRERERNWEPDKLAKNVAQRAALVAAFNPDKVVKAGDYVAPFEIELANGDTVSRDALVADGPAVLIFFRFAGCPACNLALPYYDRQLRPALERIGVTLVAISPHLPEKGLAAIAERHGLRLPVAADRDNALARRFGLTFTPADNPPIPTDDENWIGALTGTDSWELPQTAVVIIDRSHVVRFAEVSPDWLARTEAAAIISAAEQLVPEGVS